MHECVVCLHSFEDQTQTDPAFQKATMAVGALAALAASGVKRTVRRAQEKCAGLGVSGSRKGCESKHSVPF